MGRIRSGRAVIAALALAAGGLAIAGTAPAGAASPAATTVCGTICDDSPVTASTPDRLADGTGIYGRSIQLHIDDVDGVGWAIISNGDPTDEVWMDRSWDGGATWDSKIGDTTIPAGSRSATTTLWNINNGAAKGLIRACGKAGNRDDVVCTGWNSTQPVPSAKTPRVRGAIDALMGLYNQNTGLWKTTGWWNSANAMTAVLDYMIKTHDLRYLPAVAHTYDLNKNAQFGNFTNDYIDDTGWWALAWIRAYDLTGDTRYLDTARYDVDYMWSFHDDHCGGGVYWSTARTYKNAVTNELFIKAAAELHNRIPGDTDYLARSVNDWQWFRASGMINGQNMVYDGLDNTTCQNNNGTTWTYNQGVILGGLSDLYAATHDAAYLVTANGLANASTRSALLNPDGILTEPCESDGCGGDGPTFKGVYVRNLGELYAATGKTYYLAYLNRQAVNAYNYDRNPFNQYGLHWAGPLAYISGATQQSAADLMVSAIR